MTKIVTSPAGENIEIVPDAEWMQITGDNEKAIKMWYAGWKPYYFRALWEHDKFTDPVTGRVSGMLRDYIIEHYNPPEVGGGNLSGFFNANPTCFDRNTNGKRTYSLQLIALPVTWHEKLIADIGQAAYFAEPEPAPELDYVTIAAPPEWNEQPVTMPLPVDIMPSGELKPHVEPLPELPLDQLAAQQVAMSLLTEVITMIHSGSVDDQRLVILRKELDGTQANLAKRLEENDKLRQQLRAAGDEVAALKIERDGLRQRNRILEHNLNEASKNAGRVVSDEVNARIERFMRERPSPKGPDDK